MSENHYVDKAKLEIELIKFRETYLLDLEKHINEGLTEKLAKKQSKGFITEELGEMFLAIAYGLSKKNNFSGYTWKEEMIGKGYEYLCRFAKTYDHTKKNANGFAYCTQICTNAFIQYLKKEKNLSKTKDKIIKKAMEESELSRWENKENRQHSSKIIYEEKEEKENKKRNFHKNSRKLSEILTDMDEEIDRLDSEITEDSIIIINDNE